MRAGVFHSLNLNVQLLIVFVLFLFLNDSCCSQYLTNSLIMAKSADAPLLPEISPTATQISPTATPQPFLPLLAPSPLTPFTNNTVPQLSGLCILDFAASEDMMSTTSTDCMALLAPFLANVMCCPQLEATLVIVIGQSSKITKTLALNGTSANHCLSDFDQILVGQGANSNLQKICSVNPSNLTEGSCPVKDVNEFESTVNSSKLLDACEKIDLVNECCDQTCENAISEASKKLALKAYDLSSTGGSNGLSDQLNRTNDCRSIVLRWVASKLEPSRAKEILRGLSNCKVNKVCPLVFPNTSHVINNCGNSISNQSACCNAMGSYVSHLQKQSFITNLQALDCAALLGMKLQKANITKDVYNLCRISLKDFSLQAFGAQESGCLLSSLPSDATFDQSSGVSFLCDLNDNIPAPWSTSQLPASSCNNRVKIPALPAATSGKSGLYNEYVMFLLLFIASVVFTILL